SLEVELDDGPSTGSGLRFFFDVSTLQHKQANEKRNLVYRFDRVRADGAIVFQVEYSSHGSKTKMLDILKALRGEEVDAGEDLLQRAFRVFEKQSEVDYFINKDAEKFLKEQFDLWMYQYVFTGENVWLQRRIEQLQELKRIAFKIITFIAQFEDELVRVWNKPKFVRDSHYVITLDRIAERDAELLTRALAHEGMTEQVAEWRELGMVGEGFELSDVWARDLFGERLEERFQYLPLDTRHAPELEPEIVGLFDHLDQALDGWLIKSENYQALNTLQPRFREQVKCIHIDPPYNTETSGFLYRNNYQHSSWLTMMENRIRISIEMLSSEGSYLCHIDENEYERLHLLFENFPVPNAGTMVWDKRNPMNAGRGIATQHEYVVWRSWKETSIYLQNKTILSMLNTAAEIVEKHGGATEDAQGEYADWVRDNSELSGGEKAYRYLDDKGCVYQSVSLRAPEPREDPKFHKPLIHPVTGKPCPMPANGFSRTPETLRKMVQRGEIIFGEDETTQPRQKMFLTKDSMRQISSVIQDARRGKGDVEPLGLDFPYCHAVSLYQELVGAASHLPDDIILDFFAGSGTTAHAVMNLNREDGGRRKYILVEMADYFDTVLLPRVKKVAFSDNWKDGMAQEGGQGMSHFVKYYKLEQYEDVLRQARYGAEGQPFDNIYEDVYQQYVFLRDLKMLHALEIDHEANEVHVDLSKLYPDIDLAETLANLRGKWIARIAPEFVEFEDGEHIDLQDLDWELVKPLVWW
ncbi:MAG: site-specific DNA-methyltransferase, partial [Chloroflexota bacterium]|nr:site-specific DNA-methyltransferase [Chloroflexota bacterium]